MCGGGGSPSTTGGGGGSPGGTTECDRIRLVEVVEAILRPDGSFDHRPVSTRNQYINLDYAPDHPEWGRRIRLRARVAWVSGANRSLAGQTVYWYFNAGGGNRAGLPASQRASFESEGGDRARTTSTADASGWTNVASFCPSTYAGDRFDVFATDNSGYTGGMAAGSYTVWRRLFWELDCMRRPDGAGTYSDRADTGRLEQHFQRLFIQLVRTGTDGSPAHRRMIKTTEAATWAPGVRDGTGAPRYFHLCLVDTVAAGPAQVTLTLTVTPTSNRFRLDCSQYLLERTNWLVRASYTTADGVTGTVPPGNFTLTEAGSPATGDDRFVLTVSVNGLGGDLTRPVRIEYTINNWTELSGVQSGQATLVGIRWRERHWRNTPGDIGNSTLNTMVHEPGHALGLTARKLPTGANNPNYYLIPGGPHCNALSNQCLMYEANSTSTTLCTNCTDCAKGRHLVSLPIRATDDY